MFQGFMAMMTSKGGDASSPVAGPSTQILATQPASLKGYWKCSEAASAPGLVDSSGNGNTMALTGAAGTDYNLAQAGETGNAIQFLGGAGYAGIGSNLVNTDMGAQDFTIFAMVKTSSATVHTFAGFCNPSTFSRILLQAVAVSGNLLGYAEHGGDATYQPTGAPTVTNGAWYDVCFTRAANVWTVYTNATSVGTVSGGFTGVVTIAGTYIGTNLDAVGPREAFTGLIQHVAIWSVALSGAEITAIHAAR